MPNAPYPSRIASARQDISIEGGGHVPTVCAVQLESVAERRQAERASIQRRPRYLRRTRTALPRAVVAGTACARACLCPLVVERGWQALHLSGSGRGAEGRKDVR